MTDNELKEPTGTDRLAILSALHGVCCEKERRRSSSSPVPHNDDLISVTCPITGIQDDVRHFDLRHTVFTSAGPAWALCLLDVIVFYWTLSQVLVIHAVPT